MRTQTQSGEGLVRDGERRKKGEEGKRDCEEGGGGVEGGGEERMRERLVR